MERSDNKIEEIEDFYKKKTIVEKSNHSLCVVIKQLCKYSSLTKVRSYSLHYLFVSIA